MPVRETAAIRIISTIASVVTCWVLRKMLSLPASHVIRDDEGVGTTSWYIAVEELPEIVGASRSEFVPLFA